MKWKHPVNSGIKISLDGSLNVPLFADDLLLIQNKEYGLKKLDFKLHQIRKQYNIKVFARKTNVKLN